MRIRQAYDIKNLFKQLGLPNDLEAIDEFISKNTIDAKVRLYEADFWNDSQRSFLKEAHDDDEIWSISKDELNARLRSKYQPK